MTSLDFREDVMATLYDLAGKVDTSPKKIKLTLNDNTHVIGWVQFVRWDVQQKTGTAKMFDYFVEKPPTTVDPPSLRRITKVVRIEAIICLVEL